MPPVPITFWLAFDTVPGGAALPTIWKRQLETHFETFSSLFLKPRPDDLADSVPCPWNCGCLHKVVRQENGVLHGICQCQGGACGTYTVAPEERIPLELDWSKLSRIVCRAFDLQPKTVKLGFFNTLQIGVWPLSSIGSANEDGEGGAIPVVLTLASSRSEFVNILAVLVARLGHPFILLAPTARHLGPAAKELLASTGSAFFSLEAVLALSSPSPGGEGRGEGELFLVIPSSKLFADVAPVMSSPSDDDLARRTFLVLQEHEQGRRTRPPTLYTVFQLYCLQDLNIPQIARKCHCSIGTVANRLKLLQSKTGVTPEELRRVAPHFKQFESDSRQATRNYRRRSG